MMKSNKIHCSTCKLEISGSKFACPKEGCTLFKCKACKSLPYSDGGGFSCVKHDYKSPVTVMDIEKEDFGDHFIVGSITVPHKPMDQQVLCCNIFIAI
jgi:hypothetical protein